MRKARSWWLVTFWPMTADEVVKVACCPGNRGKYWFRQVAGYWDMAASLVNRGILNAELFLEGGSSGEMVFHLCQNPAHPERNAREDEEPLRCSAMSKK